MENNIKSIKFGDMVWGSCQYDTAADTFYKIKENGFGDIEIKFDSIRPIKEIREQAHDYFEREYWSDPFWIEYKDEQQKTISKIKSIEDCFTLCRDSAWDLWGAAPTICSWVFENYQTSEINDRHDGVGPIGNWNAQAENDRTGVHCAALNIHANVPVSAFMDFDT